MTAQPEPPIDATHAAFMQRGVSINVATCGADALPTLVRATGCRVSPDRRRVTVFISATQGAPLLKCLRDNGSIAVVFSEPSTHRTVQVKGSHAEVGALTEGDLQTVAAYRTAFARELEPLGYPEVLIRTLLSFPPADIVSISFAPGEAYSQTPGPRAGEPLRKNP
ncbi:MAG TPA: pyridoxamine 5'-phosphate oxidase family protein [Noviherbaspirillum sp.]|uniref:pyridoxamine 5'-phosphate oxidase family protein n=1 Tax=Noviherbaspirillum sp. TaxID=1926288 RepID=UPI002D670927|nr:pyridoxamine 5'-phosphate oxidase family protein [Noviherbaspirillum sp.]HYD95834.1 pyridoxamine 5'-phosphate oxidase family protein [Noviherbaspirillum sp.]